MTKPNTDDTQGFSYETARIFQYFVGLRFAQLGIVCLVATAILGELYTRHTIPEPHATVILAANLILGFIGIAATFTAFETTIEEADT